MGVHDDLTAAVDRLLEPLAGILMAHGVPHATFAQWAKYAYVRAAEAQGGVAGRKVSTSRLSVVTGLTRKDVARIRTTPLPTGEEAAARHHRAARIVTGWIRESAYLNAEGEPRVLSFDGDEPTFSTLVREFGGDVPPRAVLDELVRVGTASVEDDGKGNDIVTLRERAYVPKHSEAEQLEVLGTDVGGLIDTIAHNLDHPDNTKFQRRVLYDNLPDEVLDDIKDLTRKHGQALLERLDQFMAQHDRDANPDAGGTGRRSVGIGVFYFDDDDDEDSQCDSK